MGHFGVVLSGQSVGSVLTKKQTQQKITNNTKPKSSKLTQKHKKIQTKYEIQNTKNKPKKCKKYKLKPLPTKTQRNKKTFKNTQKLI